MKIILAEHFGMCFGVRDAIAQAERLAGQGPLTILGELVHNPIVRERLLAAGARESLDFPSDGSRVMITAHGASDLRHEQVRAAGLTSADGTCPLVRHAHTQLRALVKLGYFPIVIGKCGHVEVRGLTEDFPRAVVLEDAAGIAALPNESRFGVISQTTQPVEKVVAVVAALREARPEADVKFCDTVCQPTKNRQTALRKLLAVCDLIVVVGGRASNNTRELVTAAEKAGVRALHVERAEELRAEWFRTAENVGLTAGTSTLKETVAAVHARLLEFSSDKIKNHQTENSNRIANQ